MIQKYEHDRLLAVISMLGEALIYFTKMVIITRNHKLLYTEMIIF